MADYEAMYRSNHFKVDDVEAFQKLTKGIVSEDYIKIKADEDGTCFIGSYSSFKYVNEDGECGIDYFLSQLSKIIAKDDAAIFTEVGHEKLRYVNAVAAIVTRGKVKWLDLKNISMQEAGKILGKPDWETQMDYSDWETQMDY